MKPRIAWCYLGGLAYEAWVVNEKGEALGRKIRGGSPQWAARLVLRALGWPDDTRYDLVEESALTRKIFGDFSASSPTDL